MAARKKPPLSTKAGFKQIAGVKRPDPDRVAAIDALLHEHYGWAECALHHETPFQLLIATILSAQCTDEVVNRVTPELFAAYPDAEALAQADTPDVERLVHSTGFYRNKAKNIIGAARMIHEELGGELPRELDAFVKIPGAARKTANVVLGTAFGLAQGVVVDTHVARLTRHWGFHDLKDAVKIEQVLMELLPRERWIAFSHEVIWHGRRVCDARKPKCEGCDFLPHCPEGRRRVPQD
ncbi:MAG: endonuclease III [Deltaproteobacteria bacterium]|nr:endonuclease III [Deltaproteobacteria bacterium]